MSGLRLLFLFIGKYYSLVILEGWYWIYYAYQILIIASLFSIEFVYISQVCEWMAMCFVIMWQRGKTIEKMMYDYNVVKNEFKAWEIFMNRVFKSFFVIKTIYICSLTGVEISCTNLIEIPTTYGYLTMYISLFNLSLKTLTFTVLIYQMKNYQKREYDISKR